jgi:hypothetical protein
MPGRTLFIDDRADNVRAAANLGLRTLHYRGDATEMARHLPQLQPTLDLAGPSAAGLVGTPVSTARPIYEQGGLS